MEAILLEQEKICDCDPDTTPSDAYDTLTVYPYIHSVKGVSCQPLISEIKASWQSLCDVCGQDGLAWQANTRIRPFDALCHLTSKTCGDCMAAFIERGNWMRCHDVMKGTAIFHRPVRRTRIKSARSCHQHQ